MNNYSEKVLKCLLVFACWFFTACEKEHLQPDITGSQTQPILFISAVLGGDTVHYSAGVNSYVGQAWVTDTGLARYFCFYLYNELIGYQQPQSCFKIYVNNAALNPGNPETDLDSTISADSLSYQNYASGFQPSAVTVVWYDEAGVEYSSSAMPQADRFVITAVEDIYHENETYKKVTVEFDCLLMDPSFNSLITLTNGRATLLFSAMPPHPSRPEESIINME